MTHWPPCRPLCHNSTLTSLQPKWGWISMNKSQTRIPTLIGLWLKTFRQCFHSFLFTSVPHHCSNSPSFVQTENTCTMNHAKTDINNRCGHAVLSWHVFWEQLESTEAYGDAEKLESQRLLNKPIRAWLSKWESPLKMICYLLDSGD